MGMVWIFCVWNNLLRNEVEYFKQEEEKAIYLEFKVVDVDIFLDGVIDKTTFKLNKGNGNKKRKTRKTD